MSNTYNILIEDLENANGKKLEIHFEDFINEIKTKGKIKADLEIRSLGEFINITGQVQGEAILECDLCLEEFEHEFDFEIDETFAKNVFFEEKGEPDQEIELKEGGFVTDLKGSDSIDIYDLLYQSVILDFPNKKVCGINCKGGDIFVREESEPQQEIDPRMAVFKNIEIKGKK